MLDRVLGRVRLFPRAATGLALLVAGVHFHLAERGGQLAAGGLTNSHWEDFRELRPRDRNGGYEVATRMIQRGWRRG